MERKKTGKNLKFFLLTFKKYIETDKRELEPVKSVSCGVHSNN